MQGRGLCAHFLAAGNREFDRVEGSELQTGLGLASNLEGNPSMKSDHDDNIVCVAHATTPAEAHIWQNALEEVGIRCQVVGDFLDAGIGDIPGMRAELWVREQDAARAQEIIEDHRGIEPAAGDDEDEQA
jgi:hypothetical protein